IKALLRSASQSNPAAPSGLANSLDPSPTALTPASNHPEMLSFVGFTPPVGINLIVGNSGLMDLRKPAPNMSPGKSFTNGAPKSSAILISEGVIQPGTQRRPCF